MSEETAVGYCFTCKVRIGEGGSPFKVTDIKSAFNKKNQILIGPCGKCGKKVSTIAKRKVESIKPQQNVEQLSN